LSGSAKLENDRRDLIAQGTRLFIRDDALPLASVAFSVRSLINGLLRESVGLRGGEGFFLIAIRFRPFLGRHVPADARRRLLQYFFESARRAAVGSQFAQPRAPFQVVHGRPIPSQVAGQFLDLWVRHSPLVFGFIGALFDRYLPLRGHDFFISSNVRRSRTNCPKYHVFVKFVFFSNMVRTK
jgi:hypothetical protein